MRGNDTVYSRIISSIHELDADMQLRLLEDIAGLVRQKAGRKVRSILELRGLGKEVWRGINPQEYVNRERDSWTG